MSSLEYVILQYVFHKCSQREKELNMINVIRAMNDKSSIFSCCIWAFFPSEVHQLQVINLFLEYKNVKLLLVISILHEKQVIIGIRVSVFLISQDNVRKSLVSSTTKNILSLKKTENVHIEEAEMGEFLDFYCWMPSAKEVMCLSHCLCPLVGVWLVCQQDYSKNIEQIFSELGWRMCLSPE